MLQSVDSQESGSYNATNVFDGNPNTMWVTQWMAATPPHPHEIQVDLRAVYNITGFRGRHGRMGSPTVASPSMSSTSAPMARMVVYRRSGHDAEQWLGATGPVHGEERK